MMATRRRITDAMKWLPLAILLLVTVAVGCGRRGMESTVSGTVTVAGEPVPAGVEVEFLPRAVGASPSKGVTDAGGRYVLWFNAYVAGAMPGDHTVSVTVPRVSNPDGSPGGVAPGLEGVRIPADYSGLPSPLLHTVQPGRNVIDIDIPAPAPRPTK
jgi:hypothetical protein